MSIETFIFEQRDTEQHKYNYLQLKVMEKMGFGTKRSELDWHGEGYSDKYREIFAREKIDDPDFFNLIPEKMGDEAWNSPKITKIIEDITRELETPAIH